MLSTFVSTQRQTSRLRPKTGSQVGFELVRRRAVLISLFRGGVSTLPHLPVMNGRLWVGAQQ